MKRSLTDLVVDNADKFDEIEGGEDDAGGDTLSGEDGDNDCGEVEDDGAITTKDKEPTKGSVNDKGYTFDGRHIVVGASEITAGLLRFECPFCLTICKKEGCPRVGAKPVIHSYLTDGDDDDMPDGDRGTFPSRCGLMMGPGIMSRRKEIPVCDFRIKVTSRTQRYKKADWRRKRLGLDGVEGEHVPCAHEHY